MNIHACLILDQKVKGHNGEQSDEVTSCRHKAKVKVIHH